MGDRAGRRAAGGGEAPPHQRRVGRGPRRRGRRAGPLGRVALGGAHGHVPQDGLAAAERASAPAGTRPGAAPPDRRGQRAVEAVGGGAGPTARRAAAATSVRPPYGHFGRPGASALRARLGPGAHAVARRCRRAGRVPAPGGRRRGAAAGRLGAGRGGGHRGRGHAVGRLGTGGAPERGRGPGRPGRGVPRGAGADVGGLGRGCPAGRQRGRAVRRDQSLPDARASGVGPRAAAGADGRASGLGGAGDRGPAPGRSPHGTVLGPRRRAAACRGTGGRGTRACGVRAQPQGQGPAGGVRVVRRAGALRALRGGGRAGGRPTDPARGCA